MELDVLAGAARFIRNMHPAIMVEAMKTDADALRAWLEDLDYLVFPLGQNLAALHKDDKCLADIKIQTPAAPYQEFRARSDSAETGSALALNPLRCRHGWRRACR